MICLACREEETGSPYQKICAYCKVALNPPPKYYVTSEKLEASSEKLEALLDDPDDDLPF